MNGYQHKLIGMATATAVVAVTTKSSLPVNDIILGALLGGAGAMLPDIDHNNSKLGSERKKVVDTAIVLSIVFSVGIITSFFFKGLVKDKFGIEIPQQYYMYGFGIGAILIIGWALTQLGIVKWMIKHRGLMHTLVPLGALVFLSRLFFIDPRIIKFISVGFASHLFADCLTISGCPLFFPFTTKTISLVRGKDKKVAPEVRKKRVSQRFIIVMFLLIIISVGGLYAKQGNL